MTDGLRRSVRLFRSFRYEQSEPALFYTALATDAVSQLERIQSLHDVLLLDVGGGPGYFDKALREAGARCVTVERDPTDLTARPGMPVQMPLIADGCRLPMSNETFDVTHSSNVLEHVATPWTLLSEMIRVTRRGGLVCVAFTNWYSPWGGHETSPWHWFGGEFAVRRYERRHGHPPKNRFGVSLFEVHVGQALRWADARDDVEVVEARPRYLPPWARPLLRIPVAREVFTWNLAMVLRRL